MALQGHAFTSVADVGERLRAVGYLADDAIATTVFLADRLRKPLLVEGPAGVGKTELAKALAAIVDAELVRLQCYEGLDESRALYEWNYKKQLLRIQSASAGPAAGIPAAGAPEADAGGAAGGDRDGWRRTHDDIFSEEFLLARPLLTAIRREDPTVLLVDETDKADVEVEGLLLEVLSDFQITIPELGTVKAVRRPFVVLTSNASRELSEALKRRCLYLYLDYPSAAREKEIVLARVPDLPEKLAESLVRTVRALRAMELKKAPSIAETIDWAHTVLALGFDTFDEGAVSATLGVVLKHAGDQARAISQLKLAAN
jgi:MoxR-like ATPase